MLTERRKLLLLAHLQKRGRIVAKKMAEKWNLSEDTIRRDLRELAAEGRLQRVHGGALPASPAVGNLQARRNLASDEKALLGRAGAARITAGMTVFIDGGTTNLELVNHLPHDLQATVFTHSPLIAAAFEAHIAVKVILIGGTLFKHSMVAMGTSAVEMILQLRVDLFFLGVTGVHPDEGLTTGDFEEAQIKRLIASRAAETVTLVTSEKLGAASAFPILPIKALSKLIVIKDAKAVSFGEDGPEVVRV
jgi:DeoR/GlpR family transcriptional regulator of sugar metabolism